MMSPCKGSGQREPGCHGICKAYQQWVKREREMKERERGLRMIDSGVTEVLKNKMPKRVLKGGLK